MRCSLKASAAILACTLMHISTSDLRAQTFSVSSCSDDPSYSGKWILTNNLLHDQTTCLQILADNVTLDCRGYTITGRPVCYIQGCSPGSGILIQGRRNVAVKNCIIVDFGYSIWLESTTRGLLANNTFDVPFFRPVNILSSSDGNLLRGNTVLGGGYGFIIIQSSFNVMMFNTVRDINWGSSGYGFLLTDTSSGNVIASNSVVNGDRGISLLTGSVNNQIYNNFFENSINAESSESNVWDIDRMPGTNIVGGPLLGGNFWHDYDGLDTDLDGLGDSNLPYNSAGRILPSGEGDFLPLVHQDCDAGDPYTFPMAPESNDGKDNQCPGDHGYGIVDEISGEIAFENLNTICWQLQPYKYSSAGITYLTPGTMYEVVRADDATFSVNCRTSQATARICWEDLALQPGQGRVAYYLVRAVSPQTGSWGQDSTGGERQIVCTAGPDLIVESLTHDPQTPTTADTITFTAVVKNAGSATAGSSTLGIKVGGETFPGQTYTVPILQPSESFAVQRQQGSFTPQNYLITAAADVYDQVAESDENNNQTTDFLTVTAP